MIAFNRISEWFKEQECLKNQSLGFVPTMGALHCGHISLVKKSKVENNKTLVSIFVNPTQFNDPKDLEKYPRTLEKDLMLLENSGVDYVLLPTIEELYPDQYRYKITETELSKKLCGMSRPGHFDGVLTVVMKLLNIVKAQKAYFGEKDYQQLALIKGLAQAFFLNTEIIEGHTVRESDGLAMSSRNLLLTGENRHRAPQFHKILSSAKSSEEAKLWLAEQGFNVDYVEDYNNRRYGAVKLGEVRLIDNVEL